MTPPGRLSLSLTAALALLTSLPVHLLPSYAPTRISGCCPPRPLHAPQPPSLLSFLPTLQFSRVTDTTGSVLQDLVGQALPTAMAAGAAMGGAGAGGDAGAGAKPRAPRPSEVFGDAARRV